MESMRINNIRLLDRVAALAYFLKEAALSQGRPEAGYIFFSADG